MSRPLYLEPRNHDCEPDDPGKAACEALEESDGRATWRCPECGSLWRGPAKFMDGYGQDREYRWRIDWDRIGGSSNRWRRRERRRLASLVASDTDESGASAPSEPSPLGAAARSTTSGTDSHRQERTVNEQG